MIEKGCLEVSQSAQILRMYFKIRSVTGFLSFGVSFGPAYQPTNLSGRLIRAFMRACVSPSCKSIWYEIWETARLKQQNVVICDAATYRATASDCLLNHVICPGIPVRLLFQHRSAGPDLVPRLFTWSRRIHSFIHLFLHSFIYSASNLLDSTGLAISPAPSRRWGEIICSRWFQLDEDDDEARKTDGGTEPKKDGRLARWWWWWWWYFDFVYRLYRFLILMNLVCLFICLSSQSFCFKFAPTATAHKSVYCKPG